MIQQSNTKKTRQRIDEFDDRGSDGMLSFGWLLFFDDLFDIDEMDESECLAEFRCTKRDVAVLKDVLEIPHVFECSQRSI